MEEEKWYKTDMKYLRQQLINTKQNLKDKFGMYVVSIEEAFNSYKIAISKKLEQLQMQVEDFESKEIKNQQISLDLDKFGIIEEFILEVPNYFNVREYRKYLDDLQYAVSQ